MIQSLIRQYDTRKEINDFLNKNFNYKEISKVKSSREVCNFKPSLNSCSPAQSSLLKKIKEKTSFYILGKCQVQLHISQENNILEEVF